MPPRPGPPHSPKAARSPCAISMAPNHARSTSKPQVLGAAPAGGADPRLVGVVVGSIVRGLGRA